MQDWLKDSLASEELHSVEVKLGKETVTCFFRELSDFEFQKFLRADTSENIGTRENARANFLAAALRTDEGGRVVTVEEAKKLKPTRAAALIAAALKVQTETADEGNGP